MSQSRLDKDLHAVVLAAARAAESSAEGPVAVPVEAAAVAFAGVAAVGLVAAGYIAVAAEPVDSGRLVEA